VADDEHGYLYVGEEDVAIWRYDAEPNAGTSRTVVDTVGAGRLKADVEGLAIYYGPNGTGHLIASSQGNDEFVVYERTGTNAHMGTFELAGVKNTDGIEVTNVGLGSQFAQGMFVAQNNDKNFKFVPWQSIATSISPALIIDVNAWDPRGPYVPPEPPGNQAPQVNAGNDLATTVGFAVQLDATVSDDGLPAGPVTTTWTLDSGPAAVSFANAQSVDTTATFSTPGIYNLRLTVGDGELTHSDLVQVTVTEAPTNYTASFQDDVTTNGQYRGTRDTMLEGKKPNATNGADKKLSVDGSPDQAILLRWDVSSLPAGSPVQSAQLVLHVTDKSDESYPLYALLRDWDETTATWNQAASGTNWATIGAQGTSDRGTTQIGTLRGTSKGTATVELSAAGIALVQSWIDNPSTNFGIVIQNYNNSNALKIASREATGGRPRLNINIGPASAPQPATALAIATALESDAIIRKLKGNTRF